jgi:hypothetical protein
MVVGRLGGPGSLRGPAFAVVLLSLVAAGCGGARSTPDASPQPEAATDASPGLRADARALQRRWEEAERRGLAFYAPESMARAAEARAALDSLARAGADEARIRDALGRLGRRLEAAERAETRADSVAGPLLARWRTLAELGGGASPEALSGARDGMREAMRRIEAGEDPRDAVAAADRRLRDAQARVLEAQLLAPVEARIRELESADAGERAPRSLRRARAALEEARGAVERAPFDVPAATRRAWRAGEVAERAGRVAERVRRLQELDGADLEREVLAEVRHLERSAELLGGGMAAGRSVEAELGWQGRQLERIRGRLRSLPAPPGPEGALELDGPALPDALDLPPAAWGFSPPVPPPPGEVLEADRDPPPRVRIDSGSGPTGSLELAGSSRETGSLRISGHGDARFVVDIVMLVAESRDRVDAFRDRWRGRVVSGPSDGGAGRYLLENAGYYLNMAPVQEAVRAADALPDGVTYTFTSVDAMGTFGTALRAQQEGFDARVLWLDEEEGSP